MATFANIEVVNLFKEGPFVVASLVETVSAQEKIPYDAVLVGILTDQIQSTRDKFDIFKERVNVQIIKCANVEKISDELNFVKLEHLDRDLAEFLLGVGFGNKVDVLEQRDLAIEYYKDKLQYVQQLQNISDPAPMPLPTSPMPESACGSQRKSILDILDGQKLENPVALKPGASVQGYITCVTEGPKQLYVHLERDKKILNDLMNDMNTSTFPKFKHQPEIGDACTATLDNTPVLCRGMITKIEKDDCLVYFMDYGCHRVKNLKDLKSLPQRYEIYNPFAHSMRLTDEDAKKISPQLYKFFQDILQGKILHIDILSQDQDCKYTINAFHNGINVVDYVLQQMYNVNTPQYETLQLNPGNQHNIVVSWIDTSGKLPWSFYVQLEEQIPFLETLMNEIEVECTSKTPPPINSVYPNMPIVANFNKDGNWYRAQVLEANETSVKVNYVDYGNCDVISWSDTRKIRGDFVLKLPSQALKCRLISADTVETASVLFEQKYSDQTFSMKVSKQLDTGEYLVKLFDINKNPGMDISYSLQFPGQNVPINCMTPTPSNNAQYEVPIPPIPDHTKPIREALLSADPDWVRQAKIAVDGPGLPEQRTDPNLKGQRTGKFSDLAVAFEDRVSKSDIPSKRMRENWDTGTSAQEEWGDGRPASYLTREVWNTQEHAGSSKSETMGHEQATKKKPPVKIQSGPDQDRWQHDKYFELEKEYELMEENRQKNHYRGRREKHENVAAGSQNVASSTATSSRVPSPSLSQKSVRNEVFAIPKPKLKFAPLKLSPGLRKVKVSATFYKSPWEFSVQILDNASELATLYKRIAVLCKSGGIALNMLPKELDPGDACLAKFVDNKWYRAQVIEVIEDSAKVKFIDSGHISNVNIPTHVKTAAMELLVLPAQSFDCFLRGTVPKDGEVWSGDETKIFQSIITRNKMEFDLISVDIDGVYSVVAYDKDTCINTQFGASFDSLEARRDIARMQLQYMKDTDEAIIVWFTTPANFYVRLASRAIQEDDMFKFVQDIADKCPSLHTVEKGDLVLARFPYDSNYYRGIVIATRGVEAKIFRVDLGDTKVCEFSRVRALPEMLMSVPGFAVWCGMADIKPILGSDWPQGMTKINQIFQAYDSFLLTPVSYDSSGNKILVKLTSDDKTFRVAEELFKNGLAKREELPQEECSLEPGCSCNVFVSFCEKLRFCVYPTSKIPELDKLQIDLQALKLEDAENETRPGKIAAAKSTDDNMWYRVLALGSSATVGGKVISVDYGNISIPRNIKQLPTEFSKLAPFAVECQLAIKPTNNKESFHPEVLTEIDSFVIEENEKEVIVRVYDKTSTNILIVDILSPSNESLIDRLVEKRLVDRTYTEAYICYAVSPSKFYMHEANMEEKLNIVEDQLATYELQEFKRLKQVGSSCVAKFEEDGAYYRAKIISIIDTSVKVFFSDYGNTAIVSEIKSIPLHLSVIEDLAKECTLSPVPTSSKTLKDFSSAAEDGTVLYQVKLHNTNVSPRKVSLLKKGELLFQDEVEPIQPDLVTDVTVSHFKAYDDFWVQKVSEEPALDELQVKLMELKTEVLSFVCGGLICAGKDKCNDTWYRVRVLENESVHFMDYGHDGEAVLFKELPEELVEIPPFATPCQLSLVNLIHHEICEVEKLLKQKFSVFQAQFIDKKVKSTVILYKNNINIIKFSTTFTTNDDIGTELTEFVVCNYRSCFEFYIQLCKNLEKLEHLCGCLAEENFYEILDEIEEGMICITKYSETGSWHRCLVTNKLKSLKATVFLVDYGITIQDATEFRGIPYSMRDLAPMAFPCYIKSDTTTVERVGTQKINDILNDPRRPIFQTDTPFNHFADGMTVGINIFRNGINILSLISEEEVKLEVKPPVIQDPDQLETLRLQNYRHHLAIEQVVDTLEYVPSLMSDDDERQESESSEDSSQVSVHTRSDGTQSESKCTSQSLQSSETSDEEDTSETSSVEEEEETEYVEVHAENSDNDNMEIEGLEQQPSIDGASSANNESIFISDDEEFFEEKSEVLESEERMECEANEGQTLAVEEQPLEVEFQSEEDIFQVENEAEIMSAPVNVERSVEEENKVESLMELQSEIQAEEEYSLEENEPKTENSQVEKEVLQPEVENEISSVCEPLEIQPEEATQITLDVENKTNKFVWKTSDGKKEVVNRTKMSTFAFITQNIEEAKEKVTTTSSVQESMPANIQEELENQYEVASPESTKITPESTKTTPVSPTTIPESTKTTPESPTTIPESTKTIPESTKITPESTKTTPVSPTTIPESTKTTPESHMTIPESTKTTPESTKTTPENESSAYFSLPTTPDNVFVEDSTPEAKSVYETPQSTPRPATPLRRSLIPLRTSTRTPLPKVIKEELENITPKSAPKSAERKSVLETLLKYSPKE